MPEAPPPGHFHFASESVAEGCPDKLCDRVADAVLDACLAQDSEARVACQACTKSSMVMLLGEVTTKASLNYEQVIREAVKAVGYDSEDKGLDWRTMNVIVAIEEQSPDLAQASSGGASGGNNKASEDVITGEEGIVFGYATDETPELMPVSHVLATKLCSQLDKVRRAGTLPWAKLGGRAQVVIEYTEKPDGSLLPARVQAVALTVPRAADTKPEQVEKEVMEHVVRPILPESLCDSRTVYQITDPKQLSQSDVGMSGKKVASDTYGGWSLHSAASLSGKDGTKIGRSATYGARWAARSLVAANLCARASVQLSYAAGSAEPVAVSVNSFGTAQSRGKTDSELAGILLRSFDFRPSALQRELALKSPQFQKLSAYGHVGRTDLDLAWEKRRELR